MHMRGSKVWLICAVSAAVAVGCGTVGNDEVLLPPSTTTVSAGTPPTTIAIPPIPPPSTPAGDEGRGDIIPDDPEPGADASPQLVNVTDPTYGAFTVDVPDGWDNLVYAEVEGQIAKQVVTSVSPDGGTVLFVGDPAIPAYWDPDQADDITRRFADSLSSMEIAYYQQAEDYVTSYVTDKFGQLPDFQLLGGERQPDREQAIIASAEASGVTFYEVGIYELRFSFTDEDGALNQGFVEGATLDGGFAWQAQVYGGATTADSIDAYYDLANKMSASRLQTPEFTATLNQRQADALALIDQRSRELTDQHLANMQWIQDSASAHQQRMGAIEAAGDANVAGYYERMESGDVNHRQFLNYINEEDTVQGTGGTKFQVESGYTNYWVNPSTGAYAMGDINFDEQDLRELGLDPGSYEQMPVVTG